MMIDPAQPPRSPGCVDCETGAGWWLHLRRCASCGNIGCCDTSPSRHARAHLAATGHRIVQSFEPHETWFGDLVTGTVFDGPRLADPQHHPWAGGPGPPGRVPRDWRETLRVLLLIELVGPAPATRPPRPRR